jgi:hypothetical protein
MTASLRTQGMLIPTLAAIGSTVVVVLDIALRGGAQEEQQQQQGRMLGVAAHHPRGRCCCSASSSSSSSWQGVGVTLGGGTAACVQVAKAAYGSLLAAAVLEALVH